MNFLVLIWVIINASCARGFISGPNSHAAFPSTYNNEKTGELGDDEATIPIARCRAEIKYYTYPLHGHWLTVVVISIGKTGSRWHTFGS